MSIERKLRGIAGGASPRKVPKRQRGRQWSSSSYTHAEVSRS
ncbi:hypothetical protein BN903_14 [Halorubrum sp. AJ67]|nr:hypothetical protein BN903_14 [Halorubrum sp. AJ67]